jgi:transcriptional regulator NrdR family protein
MFCPRCGTDTFVIETRSPLSLDVNQVYRRRKCKKCGFKFTTCEDAWDNTRQAKTPKETATVDTTVALTVAATPETREAFKERVKALQKKREEARCNEGNKTEVARDTD